MGITDTVKWKAIYNDKSSLEEKETNGKEHAFKEIEFSKLVKFQLLNKQSLPICTVNMGDDKRLIFARRNIKTTGQRVVTQTVKNKEGKNENVKVPVPIKSHKIIIIVGWQKTVNGINEKSIFYIYPDGTIEMDDKWREDAVHSKVTIVQPEK